MKKRLIAAAVLAALAVSLGAAASGCGARARAADLTAGISPGTDIRRVANIEEYYVSQADFAVWLFKSCADGDNISVSPLSVMLALAMTANGARGETLEELEAVLALPAGELNAVLRQYLESLENSGTKLSLANSIWLRDDGKLTVERDFLQTNADYYGASVFKGAFDETTKTDINNWVSDKTNGMIKNMLDKIPDEAVMYLINALAFEGKWARPYSDAQVRSGVFTARGGEEREAEFMYDDENRYLEDDRATGFIKYYEGYDFAFAALLPSEGMALDDYIASLTGAGLLDLLNNAEDTRVKTSLPKFETEFSLELNGVLKKMGMKLAFDPLRADFSALGKYQGNGLYISNVLHKTFISVNETETKAGAATIVEVAPGAALLEEPEPKTVYLDRPFVYMLIDCETNLPFFMGTVTDAGK